MRWMPKQANSCGSITVAKPATFLCAWIAASHIRRSVLIGFSDGALVALNRSSGAVVWEANLNRNKRFRDVDATPVVDGDNVYASSYDGALYALSRVDGRILCRSMTGLRASADFWQHFVLFINLGQNDGDRQSLGQNTLEQNQSRRNRNCACAL